MTRYERVRNQRSRVWRKRRAAIKERIKRGNIQARNTTKIKGGPDVDTSLKHVPLMQRIMLGVRDALAKQDYQRAQAR